MSGVTAAPARGGAVRTVAVTLACAVGGAALAFVLASFGTKALYAVAALAALGVAGYALRRQLGPVVGMLTGGRAGVAAGERVRVGVAPAAPATPRARVRWADAAGVLVVGAAGGGVAWLAASMGLKGVLVVVAAIGLAALLAVVKDRAVFFTFVATSSLTFVMHKSFGPQDLQLSGGAISVYVTTFDVLVLLLYGLWLREGTLVADVRAAIREPIVWFPLVGVLAFLPSLLVAPDPWLSLAELVRMGWMYLLYLYVAVRVRTRRHLLAVLAGLVVFAAVELVVVVLQWRTGGVLGLSFLGVPTQLGERITDAGALGRPFGTVIHPVFLGAALGIVGMVALAMLLALRHPLARLTAAAALASVLGCTYLANTRATLVAFGVVAVVVVAAGLRRRWVSWRDLGKVGIGVALLALAFWSKLAEKFTESFDTSHYRYEVESRLELNSTALQVMADHPVVGVGLNNYEQVLPSYEASPVIFFGHPVHNLYLLVFSETGVVGFLGFLAVGVAAYDVALRLARSRDPLFGPLGVGIAAAMGFLAVEELLGFSLRQDIPLALYWLVAGLAAAATRMSGRPWPALGGERRRAPATAPPAPAPAVLRPVSAAPPEAWVWPPVPPRPRGRTVAVRSVVALVALGALATVGVVRDEPATAAGVVAVGGDPVPAGTLVLTAVDRATGRQGIYTAAADGSGLTRITPDDGRTYSWPRWAFGNTALVYTVRTGDPGGPEAIWLANADGSGARELVSFDFRVAQPSIDPTGRWLVFTATPPWFGEVALFRLDLASLESSNLTAVTQPFGGFDSDPTLAPGGDGVVFVWTSADGHAAIAEMRPDGTDRRQLTAGDWFDTDPAVSPDGSTIAIASYRGEGKPSTAGDDITAVKTGSWHVTVVPRGGGAEADLTAGADCVTRGPDDPCAVAEMSGYVPGFTADGSAVTFTGALSSSTTCICAIGLDGSDPRVVLASDALAIDWYDTAPAGLAPVPAQVVGTAVRSSRLVTVLQDQAGTRSLVVATPDLMHRTEVPLPAGVDPLEAAWAPDGQTILLTAGVDSPPVAPHPAPPPGEQRQVHTTIADLDPVTIAQRDEWLDTLPDGVERRQVFLVHPDGSVDQVTDPYLEDWRDGLAPGDARANTDPELTPDGRYLVVTSTSTLTGESFLLRVDLATGEVLSLTNATAGALPSDDAEAAVSPDGGTVAFSWTEGWIRGVYAMSTTGEGVHAMTAGTDASSDPAWLPDGASLAYVRETAGVSTVVVAPVGAGGTTGAETALSPPGVAAWHPTPAPEGDRVAYLAVEGDAIGLLATPLADPGAPRVVQPDPLHSVISVDWGLPR